MEIAGIYTQLVEGLNEIGWKADLVERNPHPFAYPSTNHVRSLLVDTCRRLNTKAQERARKNRRPEVTLGLRVLAFALWLAWTPIAITRYSHFYFVYGHSLWPWNLDLPFLRLLKKTTVMHIGHGGEARPPYLGGYTHLDARTNCGAKKLLRESRRVMRTVKRAERLASITIGAPFTTHFFATQPFVNTFHIGIPQAVNTSPKQKPGSPRHKRSFTILHAPSKPEVKGTDRILAAIEELRAEGLDISLVLISGAPNHEVLQKISDADLLVDQLFSDTPMPALATEASAQGTATILAGYGLDALKPFLPVGYAGATITCHPHELKAAIKETLVSGAYLAQGLIAQKFVRDNLGPRDVARRVARVIDGEIPSSWWVHPDTVSYHHGAGQSESESIEQISGLVKRYGPSSLQLNDKRKLRDDLISWETSLEIQAD